MHANRSRRLLAPTAFARLAGLACALTVSGVASAQNALGDGRALDMNTRQGSGGVNTSVRDVRLQARLQNAIVTGNAPGSTGFRGSLGYTADSDFRGATGSDDLFRFERDAFNSGLAARNIRSIDALKQQMQFSTGFGPSAASASELSPFVLSRPAAGTKASDLRAPEPGSSRPLSIDPFTTRPGSLRSTSEFMTASALEPVYFASAQGQNGQQVMVGATPLRGIVTTPTPGPAIPAPTRTPTSVPGATDPALATPTAPRAKAESNRATTDRLMETAQADARISDRVEPERSSYDNVMERLLAAYRGEPGEGEAEPTPAPGDPNAPEGEGAVVTVFDTGAENFVARLDRLRQEMLEREATEAGAEAAPPAMTAAEVREEVASLLGTARPMVSTLATGNDETSYHERMGDGQRLLADGFWFDAEERFVSALGMRPGDPMASVGRVHAAMGAGLFRSAAANLTQLFQAHPELAAVRFDAALLPREERLGVIVQTLRDAALNREDTFARDAGLLLAYLGHQNGSSDDVKAGLGAIDRIDAWLDAPVDPLVETLRALWLGEGEAPAE